MSDIPTDLFREILLRVRVDSLFRFRSVCKSWLRIIDDPEFSKLHIHRGTGEGWIIHLNSTGKIFLLPLSHLFSSFNGRMIHAINVKPPVGPGIPRLRNLPVPNCNGLVLISSSNINLGWVIWNPFTGECLKLPICCDEFRVSIGTPDSSYSGLGYDEASDDYKVVRVSKFYTFICSVSSGAWRRIEDFPSEYTISKFSYNGTFANRALHWIAYSVERTWELGWLVALDLTTETYRKIPLPSEIKARKRYTLTLVALSGCLFLFTRSEGFTVWMIKDYSGSGDKVWVNVMWLKENVEYRELSPIGYLKSKNWILLRYKHGLFAWYDVEKKRLWEVTMEVNPDANGSDHDDQSLKYVSDTFSSQVIPSSLVRLKRNDGANEGVAAGGTSSKRKRKRADLEKLGLMVCMMFD